MKFQTLNDDQYQDLRCDAEVIEADRHGDKVLILTDGSFLKLFRRRRLISSATIYPYSARFAANALKLKERGIPTVDVVALYKIPAIKRTAVHYQPLAGVTLRDLLAASSDEDKALLASKLKVFVERLCLLGVYFRSLHLGNIIQTPEGEFGLIDIADMRVYSRPLPQRLVKRNWKHLHRYPQEIEQLLVHL